MSVMAGGRPFVKMHGLGNDFVIVDARQAPFRPSAAEARAIADRRRGVGCDQLIILEPTNEPDADVFMRILNADGGEVEACGNGTRCVASLLIEGGGQVAASFLRADAVDRLEWFRAPILLGGEGRPCIATLALANLADAPKFRRLGVEPVGDDLWERYVRA